MLSLYLPSRMNKVIQGMQSWHLQKGIACLSVSNQKHSGDNIKLYRIPVGDFALHFAWRTFASVGSLEAGVVGQGNHVTSGVPSSNNFGRWD